MKKLEAKKVFNGEGIEFLLGAHNFSQVPNYHYGEIAFAGASNVGKSSLINATLHRKVAIVSATPGRTRQINFFKIGEVFVMADMPGYGYAKANKEHIDHWQKTAVEYLTKRANLKRVFLLLDPVKGLKDADLEMINIFNTLAVSFEIVLTKIDKLNSQEVKIAEEKIREMARKWPAFYENIIKTSAEKGYGINELQDEILNCL